MNTHTTSLFALGVMLTFSGHLAHSSHIAMHVPDTAAARSATELIARAERAIERYVSACASRDTHDSGAFITRDARIEYALNDPSAYLSIDASSLIEDCGTAFASAGPVLNIWIFPTGVKNSVFVQYDAPVAAPGMTLQPQLALVEMRGERIFRMRYFGAVPEPLLAAALRGKAAPELCANGPPHERNLANNMGMQTAR